MDSVQDLAQYLKKAKYTVVLTGAGISTESGIPDFRSTSGYYGNVLASDALSASVQDGDPQRFYKEGYQIFKDLEGKEPNRAHEAIVRLQEAGLVHEVITQNIDHLHEKAGTKDVLAVHGDAATIHCQSCSFTGDFQVMDEKVQQGEIPPRCPQCGGTLRTDVVLFGDAMPPAFDRAMAAVERADTLLVVGSSLQVMPVAYLPRYVPNLLIINMDDTPYDMISKVKIQRKAGEVFTELLEVLGV
ncbi:MAG: Sir2 family NAD-dependent protein deacetylase [Tissierellia bacterium]|nr:Sir2 family NAD-dependent protein deacetylase [Tissierellia bacterium]